MVEIKDFDDEFVSVIRKATADFICSVEDEWNENLPTREIYVPDNENIVKKDISWPSSVLRSHPIKRSAALRPAAEWIESHPEQSYRWEMAFSQSLDNKQYSLSVASTVNIPVYLL